MSHKDKLRTSPANQAYIDGLNNIDWSIGREEREAERAARKAENAQAKQGAPTGCQIGKDIEPFIDPIEGKVIGGNRQKREFMRRHGVIDVGNEKVGNKPQERPPIRDDMRRAIEELKSK